jgi:hypothetical protein
MQDFNSRVETKNINIHNDIWDIHKVVELMPSDIELEFEEENLEVYVSEKFKVVDPLIKGWQQRKIFAESVLDLLKGIEMVSSYCDAPSGAWMKVRVDK